MESLPGFPFRGRMVPESQDPELREVIVHSYRLIYHFDGETLHIMGLIHGALDLAALWERERRAPE